MTELAEGLPTRTHVTLPSGEWALWKPVLVRAPGFPAAGVTRLAAPALAVAADQVCHASNTDPEWAAYRDTFETEILRLSNELRLIARRRDFQLAFTWQNHHAVATGLEPFLRRKPEIEGRNSKYRQHEALLANYWQRYCVKNDNIGFFGPVGWGRLDARSDSRVRPGPALANLPEVFFEPWVVDRLAARIEDTGQIRRWLAPRTSPFVGIGDRHAQVPGVRNVALSEEAVAVLRRCDGISSAWQIAADLTSEFPALATERDVFEIIEWLQAQRLVGWRLEVPATMRPERDLRRLLNRLGNRDVAIEGLATLGLLEKGRTEVIRAADDPVALHDSLIKLDHTVRKFTGGTAYRNAGKTYGGRTVVYHEALRDLDLVVGRDLLAAMKPLELLLRGVRWLTHRIGTALIEQLRELVDGHSAGNGTGPSLAWLWLHGVPMFLDPKSEVVNEACAEFQRRWTGILAPVPDASRLRYEADALTARVACAFRAPAPGWSGARYCSPDILISARDADAVRRGDFRLVLGELHLAVNTLRSAFQVDRHPRPAELFDCLTAESPEPRLYPVLPKENAGRLSARTHPGLVRPQDFMVALAEQTVDADRPRLLRAADLLVESNDGRLRVTVPGGHRFDVLDVFAELLMNLVGDRFDLFGPLPHTPRVTIDRFVVCRESWTFDPAPLNFATQRGEAAQFAGARRWCRENSLPTHVFVKTAAAKKPFYVDFESPIYVNNLCKSIRVAQRASSKPEVRVTELLPALDELWLRDVDGNRYTSELRLAAVDLAGR